MQTTTRTPIVLDHRSGDHRHFLNHLAVIKVAASDADSRMSAVEFTAPRGFGPPLHQHREEDELLYVVDGELVLESGGEKITAGPGSLAFLPRQVPHTFQVHSATARFLTVTAGSENAPTFDEFVAALGTPTDHPGLPTPIPVDGGQVAEVAGANGIDILGPPPAPLD